MAKKNFDSFLETVKVPKPSIAEIEEMTREIHQLSRPAPAQEPEKIQKKIQTEEKGGGEAARKTEKKPPKTVRQLASKAPVESARRGRKPNPPEDERLIRVSVDLPESVIIDLKGRVTRERTDMKNFIRQLVERELYK